MGERISFLYISILQGGPYKLDQISFKERVREIMTLGGYGGRKGPGKRVVVNMIKIQYEIPTEFISLKTTTKIPNIFLQMLLRS